MRRSNRRLWIGLLLSVMACSTADEPAPDDAAGPTRDQTTAIQTDTTVYFLTRDEQGWGANIPYRFHNSATDTIYAVNCNGAISMAVEKKEPAGWRTFWAPITNGCLSPPITVSPGETLAAPLSLWGAPPGGNVGPAFNDTTFEGMYRLVWWNVVFHYDPDRPNFGDTVPLNYRISNEFELRAAR